MSDEAEEPTLSLIAVTTGQSAGGTSSIREAGVPKAIRELFVGRTKVPLEKVEEELVRVQAEVDHLLSKVDKADRDGFRLSEVAVSLGLSAQGSIGVVTAGVAAGITLTFSRA